WGVGTGAELRADAKSIDRCPGGEQGGDTVLVEIATGKDAGPGAATIIKDLPDRNGKRCKVTGIEAHANDMHAFARQFSGNFHGGASAVQCVVRVDQQDRAVGKVTRESAERVGFALEGHDVRVC